GWPARAGARDRGWSFVEGGRGRLQRLAGDGAPLVASLAGWPPVRGGTFGSLEPSTPLATAAGAGAAGADLRLPPRDGLGATTCWRCHWLRPFDRLESAAARRHLP